MLGLSPFRWVRRILSLAVLGAACYYAVTVVQVVTSSRAPSAVGVGPREPAVIVVTEGGDVGARLYHAAELLAAGRAPRIVVVTSPRRSAAVDRRYLTDRGVAAGRVSIVVAPSTASGFAAVSRSLHVVRAVVVADNWQTLWVTHVATAAGIRVVASPVTAAHEGIAAMAGEVASVSFSVAWGRIVGFAAGS